MLIRYIKDENVGQSQWKYNMWFEGKKQDIADPLLAIYSMTHNFGNIDSNQVTQESAMQMIHLHLYQPLPCDRSPGGGGGGVLFHKIFP